MEEEPTVPAEPPRRTAFWVVVVGLSQAWKLVISILSSVVLGRLLSPGDFGLIATISPIIAFADLFRDLGFTQAVVQRHNITSRQVSALFWLSILVTVFIAAALCAMSPFLAHFFEEPRLESLLAAASGILFLSSLSALPLAWLNRTLRFATIALIEVCSTTLGFLSAAATAWFTHSYWSLIVGTAIYGCTSSIMALSASEWRPGRASFDGVVREMARFGVGISSANLSNFVSRNADNFLIAKVNGPVALGFYDRAYKLMLVPLSQMTWPVSRVITPILSREISSPDSYRRTYFDSLSILMLCGQPGLLFCTVFSGPVIRILLGPEWAASAPIFAWLGVASVTQLATTSIVWLFISQGRGREYATLGLINSVLAVLSFLAGLHWGPLGVAASFTIVDTVVRTPFSWWYTTRRGPVGPAATFAMVAPHLWAILVSTLCLLLLGEFVATFNFPAMILWMTSTYVVYATVLALSPAKRDLMRSLLNRVTTSARKFISTLTAHRVTKPR